jgi:hypothetical protein
MKNQKNALMCLLMLFALSLSHHAQVTVSTNFTNSSNNKGVMRDFHNTFIRTHQYSGGRTTPGYRSPFFNGDGISLIRTLGGIRESNMNPVPAQQYDSYIWNGSEFVTDFTTLRGWINSGGNGRAVRMIVLDQPSWDFQRDENGVLPNNTYDVKTYGNGEPPFDGSGNTPRDKGFRRWKAYLEEAMEAIVDQLNSQGINPNDVQYCIGREIGTEAHWTGSRNEFFRFYRESIKVVRQVLPNAKVGSHFLWQSATSQTANDDTSWQEDFIAYCANNNVPYDFLAVSYYPIVNRPNSDLDNIYNLDWAPILEHPQWDSNAKLQLHEHRLVDQISGNTTVPATADKQNAFFIGMVKTVIDNGLDQVHHWDTGQQYEPSMGVVRELIANGNEYYTGRKSGTPTNNNTLINAIFTKAGPNTYEIIVSNFLRALNTPAITQEVRIDAVINAPTGTRVSVEKQFFNAGTVTSNSDRFGSETLTNSSLRRTTFGGNNSRSTVRITESLPSWTWAKYRITVNSNSAKDSVNAKPINEDVSATALDNKDIKVYPNPVNSETFNIKLKGMENANITITNTLGKVIHQITTKESTIKFKKGGLFKSGVYFIIAKDSDGRSATSKLVIK